MREDKILALLEEYITIPEAAQRLGVTSRTVDRYISDGKLPVLRLATRMVRVHPDDLAPLLAEKEKANA